MATAAYALAPSTWLLLGTSPCTVYNPGPTIVRLVVDTTIPGSLTVPSVPLGSDKNADIGIVGQNVYALAGQALTLTVTR